MACFNNAIRVTQPTLLRNTKIIKFSCSDRREITRKKRPRKKRGNFESNYLAEIVRRRIAVRSTEYPEFTEGTFIDLRKEAYKSACHRRMPSCRGRLRPPGGRFQPTERQLATRRCDGMPRRHVYVDMPAQADRRRRPLRPVVDPTPLPRNESSARHPSPLLKECGELVSVYRYAVQACPRTCAHAHVRRHARVGMRARTCTCTRRHARVGTRAHVHVRMHMYAGTPA